MALPYISNRQLLRKKGNVVLEILAISKPARHCKAGQHTVIRWVERGELNADKLPGPGDHRVLATELARIIKAHWMPGVA
jgi:hypothetical protein